MGSARYIIADVFEALESLPDNSVDLVFSSPPFLALRSYLPADHPNKAKEIGSEATPADFLDTLLDVVEACDRVLAPHGSLCFELGDTFAGSGGAGGDYNEGGLRDGQEKFNGSQSRSGWHRAGNRAVNPDDRSRESYRKNGSSTDSGSPGGGYGWPLPKSLSGIPTLFAWSLAYGRNLLRPERTTPRWRIRNVVVWARPNPPVGALGDKFRPATSYLTVACKSDKRWFDLDAVRVPYSEGTLRQYKADADDPVGNQRPTSNEGTKEAGDGGRAMKEQKLTHAGAPPLDYWEIPTQPYPGAHYATFPSKLVTRPVKSMCPERVCRTCGEPSRRITSVEYEAHGERRDESKGTRGSRHGDGLQNGEQAQQMAHGRATKNVETLGWTDCECRCEECRTCVEVDPDLYDECTGKWRAGVVLDPFAGSGTTLAVATGHGRDAIGIDLDSRNAELALERVGPLFLSVETLEGTEPFAQPAEDVETEIV